MELLTTVLRLLLMVEIQQRSCSFLTQVFAIIPPALSLVTARMVYAGPPTSGRAVPHMPGVLSSTAATPPAA